MLDQSEYHGPPLIALTALQEHHLAAVPFENLSLYCSQHNSTSLDNDSPDKKSVTNGREGYCMEKNCFFGTVLRSLGFEVFSTEARVCEAGVFSGR